MPSSNGIGTSEALAKLYSILATTGELDGKVLLKPETLEKVWLSFFLHLYFS